ncbi:MAG: transaldolase family protein [Clostridiales bacterium]|nr:transaldolase family protein [Clostridiales bacterium]MDY2834582.1 transaldolase family protein [Candidatus Aphodomonas sp.]
MLYLLDTANADEIARLVDAYPVCGVTTNPAILGQEGAEPARQLRLIRQAIGPQRMLHAQVTGKDAETMVREALALRDAVGESFYVKIPAVPEGLRAMPALKKEGLKVTATAIFDTSQALLFARAGADFVAPYVSRLDNIGADGVDIVEEIMHDFKEYGVTTGVLAASFRTADQIRRLAKHGITAVTVTPAFLEALLWHPMTDDAMRRFDAAWAKLTGGRDWTQLL